MNLLNIHYSCGLYVNVAVLCFCIFLLWIYLSVHSAVRLLAVRMSVKFMILYCSGDCRVFVVDSCLRGGAFGCTSSKTS